ncbi:MAG: lamin tail domain-containing protein [Minicystis sp.]
MRAHRTHLTAVVSTLFLLAACSSGTSSSSTTSGTTGEATTTATTTTTGSVGAGGAGGGSTTSTTATTGTGGSSTTSTTGSGGAGGAPVQGDHLLISEVGVSPGEGEFVEIENPTASAVDLSEYYLSDNSAYYGIAAGQPWNPVTANPGTDFLAQFPAGTMLAPGARIVIATDPGYETTFNKCPDFILAAAPLNCAAGMAKAMLAPTNGGIGDQAGTLLSNSREMLVLFHWDGVVNHLVEDIDYVTWGTMFDDATRADKSAVAGYKADTGRDLQKPAIAPTNGQSIERCGATLEPGEKASGGNGIKGHDETSEAMNQSFKVQTMPTPGAKNSCL